MRCPLANPSFLIYHVSLHLKQTWLTAMFNSLVMNFLATDVDASCSISFLKTMSFASLCCKLLYKIFRSTDQIFFGLNTNALQDFSHFDWVGFDVWGFKVSKKRCKNLVQVIRRVNRQWEDRSQSVFLFMQFRQLIKTDGLPPSRPHPCVYMLTYLIFFPHCKEIPIDVFF